MVGEFKLDQKLFARPIDMHAPAAVPLMKTFMHHSNITFGFVSDEEHTHQNKYS